MDLARFYLEQSAPRAEREHHALNSQARAISPCSHVAIFWFIIIALARDLAGDEKFDEYQSLKQTPAIRIFCNRSVRTTLQRNASLLAKQYEVHAIFANPTGNIARPFLQERFDLTTLCETPVQT